mmetsp:Transcript_8265/g.23542  ORF Transcript_8265/g.23542 Transcript_8265/m.23542 type:complete len:225 (-) Transcript_8265:4-678(-)
MTPSVRRRCMAQRGSGASSWRDCSTRRRAACPCRWPRSSSGWPPCWHGPSAGRWQSGCLASGWASCGVRLRRRRSARTCTCMAAAATATTWTRCPARSLRPAAREIWAWRTNSPPPAARTDTRQKSERTGEERRERLSVVRAHMDGMRGGWLFCSVQFCVHKWRGLVGRWGPRRSFCLPPSPTSPLLSSLVSSCLVSLYRFQVLILMPGCSFVRVCLFVCLSRY